LVAFAVGVGHGVWVVPVIKVLHGRILRHDGFGFGGGIARFADRSGPAFGLGAGGCFGHVGIAAVDLKPVYFDQVLIDRLDAVEPTLPEPVQIHARRIFECAEEISGFRAFEGPPAGVFLEGIVE